MIYLSVKALHILIMIAWVAALLIYPRYKLHQQKGVAGSDLFETMQQASARLRKIILTPALILVWLLGIAMLVMNPGLMQMGWVHAKLTLALGLTGLHGYYISLGKKIDRGEAVSASALKWLNELPFILAGLIIFLAVLKPF